MRIVLEWMFVLNMPDIKILASCLTGSRTFNLDEKNSDIDLCIVASSGSRKEITQKARETYPTEDLHCYNAYGFLLGFFNKSTFAHQVTNLIGFPIDSFKPIFDFLQKESNNFILANKKKIYQEYLNLVDNRFSEQSFRMASKSCMNWIRLLKILQIYETKQDWKSTLWVEEPLRSELLRIKHKTIDFNELEQIFNENRQKVIELHDFYCVPEDKEYNEWFYSSACEILDISYENLIELIENIPQSRKIIL